MSRLTYEELREQGAVIAGNDAADTWVKRKMNAWLRKHYDAYPWPFLITQLAGIEMAAGTTAKLFGAGEAGISQQIVRVFSPIYFRANGYSTRGRAPIRQLIGNSESMSPGNVDPSTQTGTPQSFVGFPIQESDGLGQFYLIPYPIPDKTYTLSLTAQRRPNDLADDAIPEYPNEMTLIQACKCAALEYDETGSQMLKEELDILAQMVAADRDTYGGTSSFGDSQTLDTDTFK